MLDIDGQTKGAFGFAVKDLMGNAQLTKYKKHENVHSQALSDLTLDWRVCGHHRPILALQII